MSGQGSDVEAKNGMNVGSGERTAAALRAGRFPPVEGQGGSCVPTVQGSDVECKAAMWRLKEMSNVGRGKEQQQPS